MERLQIRVADLLAEPRPIGDDDVRCQAVQDGLRSPVATRLQLVCCLSDLDTDDGSDDFMAVRAHPNPVDGLVRSSSMLNAVWVRMEERTSLKRSRTGGPSSTVGWCNSLLCEIKGGPRRQTERRYPLAHGSNPGRDRA